MWFLSLEWVRSPVLATAVLGLAVGCRTSLGAGPVLPVAQDPPADSPAVSAAAPLPPDPARLQALRAAASKLDPAIVRLEQPGEGAGSGFVISKKHRLVATAAHIADLAFKGSGRMMAHVPGAGGPVPVLRVFYHPATFRTLDELLYLRSDDPQDGEVNGHFPDVAVLELADDGSQLHAECAFATDGELASLGGCPVAAVGFPGDDGPGDGAPDVDRPVIAVGVVIDGPPGARRGSECVWGGQFLWSTATTRPGMSGSPVVSSNGRVVGVVCGAVGAHWRDSCLWRADSVRDLLWYHNLGDVDPAQVERARSRFGPTRDPRLEHYRTAAASVREAARLRWSGDYANAIVRCNDVVNRTPDYLGAFLERSRVYLYYLGTHWQQLTDPERHMYSDWALADSARCVSMSDDWESAHLTHMQNVVYRASMDSSHDRLRTTAADVTKFLGDRETYGELSSAQRSFALNIRAQCYHFLGEMVRAAADYGESIASWPDQPRWYLNRAQFWDDFDMCPLADMDRTTAAALSVRAAGSHDGDVDAGDSAPNVDLTADGTQSPAPAQDPGPQAADVAETLEHINVLTQINEQLVQQNGKLLQMLADQQAELRDLRKQVATMQQQLNSLQKQVDQQNPQPAPSAATPAPPQRQPAPAALH